MSRLLSILILSIFVLSIIPPVTIAMPITVTGAHRKLFSGSHTDFYYVAEANGYIGFVALLNKGNYRGDVYLLTIKKSDGTVGFNSTIATDNGKAPFLASNGTHFLIAYAEYDGSNYHLVLAVHNGTHVVATKDISSEISSLPDSAGLYPVAVWMPNAEAWIIGWYDNSHGDTLHVAVYDKYLNQLQVWDSSHGGASNNMKYFVAALYDEHSGKAVLVGRLKGDSGSSYGIYVVTVSWTGSSFTFFDRFLTSTGSLSEGSRYVYYYNARGPVAAITDGKLIIVYEAHYKNPQPLKYIVYDVATDSIVNTGEIEGKNNIAGGSYSEGAQPRVAAGNGYFVVTYTTKNDEVYAASIDTSGNLVGKIKLCDRGAHKKSWATPVYNGTKYTFIILYPNVTGSQIDMYAVRFNASTLQTGASVPVLSETYNETSPVAHYSGGKIWFAYVAASIDIYDLADADVPALPAAPAGPVLLPGQLSNVVYDAKALKIAEVGTKYIAVWVEETDTSNYVGDLYFAVIDKATGAYEYGPTKVVSGVQDRRRVGSAIKGGTPQLVSTGTAAYVIYVNGTSSYDIGIAELHTDGTFTIVYNYTASGYQETVAAAYDPDHSKLAVFLLDNGNANVLIFDTTNFSAGPTTITIGPGGYYKYFQNDIVYANGYFVAAFLNRSYSVGGTYLAIIDAATNSLVTVQQIGGLPTDYSGQGPSIAYLASASKFLVAYINDDSGDAHVFATMFNLTATGDIDTAVSLVIDNVTDVTKYPYVVAGSDSWLVTWEKRTGSNDVYGALVLPDGTVLGTLGLGADGAVDEGFARAVWEPALSEWIVLYGYNLYAPNTKIYGVRVNKSAYIGTPAEVLSDANANLTPAALLSLGNGTEIYGYYNETDNVDPWYRFFDASTLPAPSKPGYIRQTRIVIQAFTDSTGDGVVYVGDGETVHIEAQLQYYDAVDKEWKNATYADQEITVKISRITYYGAATYTGVYTTTAYTDASGRIVLDIDPNTFTEKLSTVYSLYLSYPGNDTVNLQGSVAYTDKWTEFLPVVYATPAKTIDGSLADWETTTVGAPALVYKNGELIVTDPSGDLRYNATYNNVETSDVDLTELHMAVDNNFLYIAYRVAGSAEVSGTIVPALAIAIDFNSNPDDGALHGSSYNLKLWHTYVYSDTTLKGKRGWDVLIVLMPVFKPYSTYTGVITVNTPIVMVYKNGTTSDYVETFAGVMAISGDTVEAAIPLDIIGYWHYNDPTVNPFLSKNITIFNAIFPINVTKGRTYGIPYADFADFAGGVFNPSNGTVPAGILNQGYTKEDYTDKELDFYIVAAIDNTGKFFGYARVWSLNKTVYSEHKAYTGQWSYGFRILDHLNPMFGVPGVTVTGTFNTSSVSGTTNATGYVFLAYAIDLADAGKPITLTVSVSSADYVSLDRSFELTVYVPIKYVDGGVVWHDANNDGVLNAPDQLYIWAKVYTRLSDGSWGPAAGVKVPFIIHSTPYLLGYGVTNSSGIADLTYTVNGTEEIIGYHDITLDDSGTTDVLGGPITLPGGGHILMVMSPAPEPPVLPLLLLAALLLFIIIKKRK